MKTTFPPFRLAFGALVALSGSVTACEYGSAQLEETHETLATTETSSQQAIPQKLTEEGGAPEATVPKAPPGLPALQGEHFGVFDMLHNRPLAHRVQGDALIVDASQDDFLRYINGNYPEDWQLDLEVDERPAAAIKGSKVDLWFPALSAAPGGVGSLTLRLHSSPSQNALSLKLNGVALPEQKLEQGWQTLEIALPEGALEAENTLALTFSNMGRYNKKLGGAALSSLVVGSGQVEDEAISRSSKLPMAQSELELASGDGLAWHLWALPKSKIAVTLKSNQAGCGVSAEVWRQRGAAGELELAGETTLELKEAGKEETFFDVGVASKAEQGEIARVVVRALKGCGEQTVTLERAELVVPGQHPERPAELKPPKYVLFWMVDTLRADHLPFYNEETDVEAPALSKLVDEGALFEVAYVQGNESKVSHASLFSGMYPSKHRVLAKGSLKPHHQIIPEAMKEAGYRTGAHISNGYISKPWGFDQGWDHFINNLRDGWRIDGASMAEHGIKWATENKEAPFFLYVGTIDPHVTYRRHDEIIERYDTDYSGRYDKYCSGEDLGRIKGGGLKPNDRDKERIKNLYKNEITFNDQAFAAIRRSFEEQGIWEETMVVVTADHGDEFWEHGSVGHGHSVHQELVHVPLLMYYPPLIEAGTRVNAGVDVLDIYPTLVDLIGGTRPEALQGKSLVPLLLGEHGGYPEPAIATRYLGHYAMQMQQYKLYLKKGDYAVYDREKDPLELENAKADNPLAARWLLDAMAWFRSNRKSWDKQSWGVADNLSGDFLTLRETSDERN